MRELPALYDDETWVAWIKTTEGYQAFIPQKIVHELLKALNPTTAAAFAESVDRLAADAAADFGG
jgi:hypothetical protein